VEKNGSFFYPTVFCFLICFTCFLPPNSHTKFSYSSFVLRERYGDKVVFSLVLVYSLIECLISYVYVAVM
jgi:hypothetical protein